MADHNRIGYNARYLYAQQTPTMPTTLSALRNSWNRKDAETLADLSSDSLELFELWCMACQGYSIDIYPLVSRMIQEKKVDATKALSWVVNRLNGFYPGHDLISLALIDCLEQGADITHIELPTPYMACFLGFRGRDYNPNERSFVLLHKAVFANTPQRLMKILPQYPALFQAIKTTIFSHIFHSNSSTLVSINALHFYHHTGLFDDKLFEFAKRFVYAADDRDMDATYLMASYPHYSAAYLTTKSSLNAGYIFYREGELGMTLHTAMSHGYFAKLLAPYLSRIRFIDIHTDGSSANTASLIAKNLLDNLPAINMAKFAKLEQASVVASSAVNAPVSESPKEVSEQQKIYQTSTMQDYIAQLGAWELQRLLGRTIILQDQNGNLLALKVQKKNEKSAELQKEFDALKNKSYQFHSYRPTPLTVQCMTDILPWLKTKVSQEAFQDFSKMINEDEKVVVFVYQVSVEHKNYFTYLYDPSLSAEEFSNANRTSLIDLCQQLARGIVYPQLADIFHNLEITNGKRNDKGRYIVLAELMSSLALITNQKLSSEQAGAGRVDRWKEAVAYPNVRGTGLADWGDTAPLAEWLMPDSARVQKYYSAAKNAYKDKVGNYLIANIIAEYLHVLYLTAGKRAELLSQQNAGFDVWVEAAKQLISNSSLVISQLTNYSEKQARAYLEKMVSVDLLARQMQFWMTTEYVDHVMKNKIPEGVYAPNTKVSTNVDLNRPKTFHPLLGFSLDGINQDLGPVNGEDPIKEASLLFYNTVNIILMSFDQFYRNAHCKSKTFSHLGQKEYHGRMFAVTRQRLLKKQIPVEERANCIKEMVQHKKGYAATVIQRAWRNRFYKDIDFGEEAKVSNIKPTPPK